MATYLYNRTKEPKFIEGSDGNTYDIPPRSRKTLPEGVELVNPLPAGVKLLQPSN